MNKNIKRRIKTFTVVLAILFVITAVGSVTVLAEPQDYPDYSSAPDTDISQPDYSYPEESSTDGPLYEDPVYSDPYEETEPPYYPEETEPEDSGDASSAYEGDIISSQIDNWYAQTATDPPTEMYTERPTQLFEIPFEGEEGNLFIGLSLWIAIIIGVIIVITILISTHRRKKS